MRELVVFNILSNTFQLRNNNTTIQFEGITHIYGNGEWWSAEHLIIICDL